MDGDRARGPASGFRVCGDDPIPFLSDFVIRRFRDAVPDHCFSRLEPPFLSFAIQKKGVCDASGREAVVRVLPGHRPSERRGLGDERFARRPLEEKVHGSEIPAAGRIDDEPEPVFRRHDGSVDRHGGVVAGFGAFFVELREFFGFDKTEPRRPGGERREGEEGEEEGEFIHCAFPFFADFADLA